MSKINVDIDNDLDREFRLIILEELGGKQGSLKKAVEESIELWINKHRTKSKKIE